LTAGGFDVVVEPIPIEIYIVSAKNSIFQYLEDLTTNILPQWSHGPPLIRISIDLQSSRISPVKVLRFDISVVTVRDGVAAILRGPNTHLNNLTHSPIKMGGLNVNKVDGIVGVVHVCTTSTG
jgi:hypothetical protein